MPLYYMLPPSLRPICLIGLLLALSLTPAAHGLTLTASSSSDAAPSLPAKGAVDGNPGTFWSSAVHGDPAATEWLRVDLDRTINLAGVTLTPRGGGYGFPRAYTIEYSYDENGTYWFPVPGAQYSQPTTVTQPVTHTFTGALLARRLRITATRLGADDFGNSYFQLTEVAPVEGATVFPFKTSNGDAYDARLNMLWTIYGSITDGSSAVYPLGGEPTFHDWMTQKYTWSATTADKFGLLAYGLLVQWPQSADGYLWSWSTEETWPTVSKAHHNDGNAKYILACWRAWCWTRNDALFDLKDNTTVGAPTNPASRPDTSNGKTLREKLRLAMQYLEKDLKGGQGGITIEDNGMGNDGTVTGAPTNYWDNLPFGYQNAYDNIYYYAALEAMAQLEEQWGNPGRARQLRAWQAGCKTQYDSLFWDETKGRYIGCIDKNGVKQDFGFTFLNLEALTYGLSDAAKAGRIFDWLDGRRTVAGETSTGADIYHWKFAPRANTRAIESAGPPYWWDSLAGAIRVDQQYASYGNHLENGGAILYTSYFDLMARLHYLGPDQALARLNVILDEFNTDQLRRDPKAAGVVDWVLGTIGEFPESGLVPCFLTYGFAGLEANAGGLRIRPQLPTSWTELTVRQVNYAGCLLDVTLTPGQVTVKSVATSGRTLYLGHQALAPGGNVTAPVKPGESRLLTLAPATGAEHGEAYTMR